MLSATLYTGISHLVLPWEHAGSSQFPLDVVADGALLTEDGRVLASGAKDQVAHHPRARQAVHQDLQGCAVLPGLVDSHTHIAFAHPRMDEFAQRCRGATYEEIAAQGGGILNSAQRLQQTSEDALYAATKAHFLRLRSLGTTTVEIKSGYGLTPEAELKQLRVVHRLAQEFPGSVRGTVLAHVIPLEFRQRRQAYIDHFCHDIMAPAHAQGYCQFVDIFVEHGAFTLDEARRIAAFAQTLNLSIKLHVDQLRDGQGATLAAELGALSADHLEYTSPAGQAALAKAQVVGTILPGCGLFLGKGPWPDGRALRDHGVEVAVATDCNPGSSMVFDLALCGTLAATRCGLTLEEALWGMTRGGAKALGLHDRGRLAPGERADFVVLDNSDWRSLLYYPGTAPIKTVVTA